MNVATTEFRARLRHWLDCARSGEEVVITERGVPVARLSGIDSAPTIERLTAQGVISRPVRGDRPKATGQRRPRPRSPLSDLVSDQRR
ncbi:type II toxin-antitoxin system Phd/YefM family antitoxin [Candidatus Poriferisodalis sp.]|uniref:type II toxin-antitoxin system Phd/YefM family antitoxin n=1 Tax=Candidatus Poriferisodalis sp. TaxID=3101277 RepID=UPI003AF45E5A